MTIMLVLSFLLAVALPAIAIWKTREIPVSISSLVYLFDGNRKWLWSLWLGLVTFTLAPSLIESIHEPWKFLGFFTLLSLVLTAAMPLFDKEHEKWHHVFGIAAGVMSQVCVAWINAWWLLLWVIPLYALALDFAKDPLDDDVHVVSDVIGGKGVFVLEIMCMATLYAGVLVH